MSKPKSTPIVMRGEDLTGQMLEDFRPFVKDFPAFCRVVKKHEEDMSSPVIIIESYPYLDGRPGIMEKLYYFEEDTSCPDWELNAIAAGVESL